MFDACPVKICEVGGSGMFFPAFEAEQEWPKHLRVVLYLSGLLWSFMGVAIVADTFMGAIERITAQRRSQIDPVTQKPRTVQVWNDTVANLTLVALGSSAPEILLSVIELFSRDFYSGALGPSTIVGSAAFNLLCITAVCIVSIPYGEVKKVKETAVFAVTSAFSVFAYVWLYFIVALNTKDVIDIWESAATLLLFPLLVVVSYLADRGYFHPAGRREELLRSKQTIRDKDIRDFAVLQADLMKKHPDASEEEVARMLAAMHEASLASTAHYRSKVFGGRASAKSKVSYFARSCSSKLASVVPTFSGDVARCDEAKNISIEQVLFDFPCPHYAVLEKVGLLNLDVLRTGGIAFEASVEYETRDGTALAGDDFEHIRGTLTFKPGEDKKVITVRILDDTNFEDDEEFYVDLSNPRSDPTECTAKLGQNFTTKVIIVDDDHPGILSFAEEVLHVNEGGAEVEMSVCIKRTSGHCGYITCKYATENATALAGTDYVKANGVLCFDDGQLQATVTLKILPAGRYETVEQFRLILSDVTGGAILDTTQDGGAKENICTIIIHPDQDTNGRVDRVFNLVQCELDKAMVANLSWRDQFAAALEVNADEDPSVMDWAMHIVTVFWKLLFACIPPPDFCGGWCTFFSALIMIGLVTAAIADLAALLGCIWEIPDSITAITLVALGTSMPDLFASKTAATQGEFADASIGNVTGSNSVNVFLGLGLPWFIGSLYWAFRDEDAEWVAKYSGDYPHVMEDNKLKLVVLSGDLGFSVGIFLTTAVVCLGILVWRRHAYGGELGGPANAQIASAGVMVFLWFLYVFLSCWQSLRNDNPC